MEKKSILLGIVIIVVIILGLTPDGRPAQKQRPPKAVPKEQPKMGGTLIYAMGKEFAYPNPFVQTQSVFQFVKENAYESLLTRDEKGKIVPHLASAYEVSAGGTEITVRLRKGIKFHHGKEMTADAVLWSANHVKNPKNGALGQSLITGVRSVEMIDDYTVRFTLSKPSVVFLTYLADIRMLPIVPANSLQTGQIKLETNAFVPGTGPFIFEQYQPGFNTVLRKYPEYWGGQAYLDKLIFRPIADDANRFNALRTGDVHMADRLTPLDAMRLKKGDIKGIRLLEDPLGGYRHLRFNYLNPLFQKLAMRQAIAHAIDKQRLIDEVFFGAAKPAEVMMDPQSAWSKAANLPAQKRDLAQAKALLKAAGYNGQELVTIGRRQDANLYEAVQRMLGEAGIKVKVEIVEAGIRKDRFMDGKYDLYVDGASLTPDPVVTMMPDYYTSKTIKGSYSNPKADQLLDNLGAEFDEKNRLKIFKDLAWLFHNDVATIPLFYDVRYAGMSEKVQGYGPPRGQNTYDSEDGRYFKHAWLK